MLRNYLNYIFVLKSLYVKISTQLDTYRYSNMKFIKIIYFLTKYLNKVLFSCAIPSFRDVTNKIPYSSGQNVNLKL